MSETIETWTRTLRKPHAVFVRTARRDLFWAWNRYGGIPGTPHKGVTIGWCVGWRGRSLSFVWARPVVTTEPTS